MKWYNVTSLPKVTHSEQVGRGFKLIVKGSLTVAECYAFTGSGFLLTESEELSEDFTRYVFDYPED